MLLAVPTAITGIALGIICSQESAEGSDHTILKSLTHTRFFNANKNLELSGDGEILDFFFFFVPEKFFHTVKLRKHCEHLLWLNIFF